jgi:hypothetical protein
VVAEEAPQSDGERGKGKMSVQVVCPHCGFSKSIPEERIPPGVKTAVCPLCKQRFELAALKRATSSGSFKEKGRMLPPWERRPELGVRKSIGDTVKGVLFSPVHFFRTAAVEGGVGEPLAFGILMGSLGMIFEIFWQVLMNLGDFPSLSAWPFGRLTWGPVFTGVMMLSPVLITLFICLTSLVAHVLLVMVRGGKNRFEATFRAVCYAQSTQIWAVLPFVGSLLAGLWIVVVQVIGLREIHGISYAKVIFAILIPFVLIGMVLAAVLIPLLISVT